MSAAHDEYVMGRSEREYARLERQARILAPATRRLFIEAGIGPGMRVLDVGSGAGDVCMLLAELVGPSGAVTGLDLDDGAIDHARQRMTEAGLGNVSLVHSEFSEYAPPSPLDAIVGRFVLMYQAKPGAALAALTRHLKPGGIVAFIEPWFQTPGGPDSTIKQIVTIMVESMVRSGAHIDLGIRLHRVFAEAGLPVPSMRFEAVMDGHEDSPLFQFIADTVGNILPKAIEYGVPGAAELDVTAIPARLRAELGYMGYAMLTSPMVTAWCRKQS